MEVRADWGSEVVAAAGLERGAEVGSALEETAGLDSAREGEMGLAVAMD